MANSTHDRRRRNITEAATANNAKEDGSRMMGASGHCHRQKTDGRCSVGCPQPTRCSEPIGWGQPTLQRWQYQDAPCLRQMCLGFVPPMWKRQPPLELA